MKSLTTLIGETPYVSYTYSYPHKMAYRCFETPIRLDELWAQEDRDALFLYMHIPFCEMRCGFCNLFTTANPAEGMEKAYLDAITWQAERVQAALGKASFARMALGGGTPTYLSLDGLTLLFNLAEDLFGVSLGSIPISVETSPFTAQPDKLALLRERGVNRISIGVQSFLVDEVKAVGRAQNAAVVAQALEQIRAAKFPILNIDLMYGLPGQSVSSWLESLRIALSYQPEELYIYPLYVRPLTGLDRHLSGQGNDPFDDIRLACYRAGREFLLDARYTQVSMRMFRAGHAPAQDGPVYCVQEDGMVGIGCGARSYTSGYHYASEYAVSARGVRAILADYVAQPAEAFDCVPYGFKLNGEEQRRRYVIKSILEADGLSFQQYRRRFGTEVMDDLPQLGELIHTRLAVVNDALLTLTETGIERSDTIGPWLYSDDVRDLMGEYELA
jgi:oxygen-independent coproporphyrinogen III oxidase